MKPIDTLKKFAGEHGLILEDHGEVGFGRPCVGFLTKGTGYADYNPLYSSDYTPVWDEDERLFPPPEVNAYHKHDCFAVLVVDDDYEEALSQLLLWIVLLQGQGELEVVEYETKAQGLQAMMSGIVGYAIRFKL